MSIHSNIIQIEKIQYYSVIIICGKNQISPDYYFILAPKKKKKDKSIYYKNNTYYT